jgi:serine/threonine protein kinase
MRNLVGHSLDKYQITDELGRGGMGVVYRAYDADLRRYVALKVLRPQMVSDEQLLERFRREAVTVANLKHPHIVTVHDVGTASGYYYIVMELLEGHTLRQEIEQTGALPLPQVTHIVQQLASALDYAHQRDIIHRDVKAGNVILGAEQHVTLTDFGLAKLRQQVSITQPGLTTGTLKFMAPEQISQDSIDHRADVYALGVVTYEMLCGCLPYEGDTPHQLLQGILYTPPLPITQVNPSLSVEIEQVLTRALAKRPEDRFYTAGEMSIAMQRLRPLTGLRLVTQDQREFPLSGLVTSLGRNADNTIVLQDAQVSRYHAVIRSQASAWFISDQGSTNGTFVNARRLPPRQPHPLQAGDVLRLGSQVTLYVQESEMMTQRPTEAMMR